MMGCKARGPRVIDPNLPKGDVEKNPYCRYAMEHEGIKGVGCPYWKGTKRKWKRSPRPVDTANRKKMEKIEVSSVR